MLSFHWTSGIFFYQTVHCFFEFLSLLHGTTTNHKKKKSKCPAHKVNSFSGKNTACLQACKICSSAGAQTQCRRVSCHVALLARWLPLEGVGGRGRACVPKAKNNRAAGETWPLAAVFPGLAHFTAKTFALLQLQEENAVKGYVCLCTPYPWIDTLVRGFCSSYVKIPG